MRHLIFAAIVLCFAFQARAAEPAKREAPKPAEYLLGEMHIQDLPAVNYIYGGAETTFDKMMEVIGKYMPMLTKGMDEGKIRPAGSGLFIYKGVKEDMSKPFTLEVGWCVPDNAQPVGELKVRKIPAAHCATLLYTGSAANISKAYEKLMPAIDAAGLKPVGDMREMYLYWEGAESVNNVIQFQVEVK
jgi:effector-binding domain-containing protein